MIFKVALRIPITISTSAKNAICFSLRTLKLRYPKNQVRTSVALNIINSIKLMMIFNDLSKI